MMKEDRRMRDHQAQRTSKASVILLAGDTCSTKSICCLVSGPVPAKTEQVMIRIIIVHMHDDGLMCV